MKSMASAQQSEVKAWEEELEMCEHTLMLQQEDAGKQSRLVPAEIIRVHRSSLCLVLLSFA